MQYSMLAGKFLSAVMLMSQNGGGGAAISSGAIAEAQSAVMPIVAAALLLDSAIVGIWYLLGVLLSNDRVKSSARGEMYQLVGTVILAMMLIGFMLTWGNAFFNILNTPSSLMSPAAINSMCSNVALYTQLDLIGSTAGVTGVPSLLTGPQNAAGTAFTGICDVVRTAAGGTPTLTEQMDYPLAAAATIIANVTNQTATNLNSAFTFDAFVDFMFFLRPSTWICQDSTSWDSLCITPIPGALPASIEFEYYSQPFGGYDILLTNLGTLGALLTTAVEICCAQLNFVVICIYIWPYLLFIGLALRSTLFTRPIGGLFIAAALAIVLVFPAVYAIEYLALANPNSSLANLGTTYGFNPLTSIYPSSTPSGTKIIPYTLNFFVQPSMAQIINDNGCWPGGYSGSHDNGLFGAEVEDTVFFWIPGASLLSGIASTVFSGYPSIFLPSNLQCGPPQVLQIFFELLNAYGLMGIDIYILPLLNIIIALTAMRGLSGLMGGDTELAGLARIIP